MCDSRSPKATRNDPPHRAGHLLGRARHDQLQPARQRRPVVVTATMSATSTGIGRGAADRNPRAFARPTTRLGAGGGSSGATGRPSRPRFGGRAHTSASAPYSGCPRWGDGALGWLRRLVPEVDLLPIGIARRGAARPAPADVRGARRRSTCRYPSSPCSPASRRPCTGSSSPTTSTRPRPRRPGPPAAPSPSATRPAPR